MSDDRLLASAQTAATSPSVAITTERASGARGARRGRSHDGQQVADEQRATQGQQHELEELVTQEHRSTSRRRGSRLARHDGGSGGRRQPQGRSDHRQLPSASGSTRSASVGARTVEATVRSTTSPLVTSWRTGAPVSGSKQKRASSP